MRPISLLALPLLTLLDSNFPVNPLWAWEFHPLKLRLCSSQALRNPVSVGRSGVCCICLSAWKYISAASGSRIGDSSASRCAPIYGIACSVLYKHIHVYVCVHMYIYIYIYMFYIYIYMDCILYRIPRDRDIVRPPSLVGGKLATPRYKHPPAVSDHFFARIRHKLANEIGTPDPN